MKRRNLTPQILAALRDTPVVYLQGPRQAGKSTLALSKATLIRANRSATKARFPTI
jgi:predicted AAA+ superfamily ATPase